MMVAGSFYTVVAKMSVGGVKSVTEGWKLRHAQLHFSKLGT